MAKPDRTLLIRLQEVLYNLAMYGYGLLIRLASYRNEKARKFLEGRNGLFRELRTNIVTNEHYIWFHCASLGEFEQGRPLIEQIRSRLPHARLVVTFFSPSGYELCKDYDYVDEIYYLPIDTLANARKFVTLLRPKVAIFMKYDFWYNHLRVLREEDIPTLLVSGRFRRDQLFFRGYASLARQLLQYFDHFFVQDQNSQSLLKELGVTGCTVIPDTRIDRVQNLVAQVGTLPELESFRNGRTVMIGGSTYEEEETWLQQWQASLDHPPKLVIAPHEPSADRVQQLQSQFRGRSVRYTQLNEPSEAEDAEVLLIDKVGLLGELYQYGHLALIGGGFRKSIHNILEPAAHGLPLLFGPNHHKFPEARALIDSGGALSVDTYEAFSTQANRWLDPAQRVEASKACRAFIAQNQGGTDVVYQYIIQTLDIPAFRVVPDLEYLR